jgi:hypothetical protein
LLFSLPIHSARAGHSPNASPDNYLNDSVRHLAISHEERSAPPDNQIINAFALLTERMDCVEHCLKFIDQRVPDAAAGIRRKYGLQFSGPVFIRFSQGGRKLELHCSKFH